MKSKTNNAKVPKSDKTRLSDMRPKKDARGGKAAPIPPAGTPPMDPAQGQKGVTLPPY
jgi:hypothetical protein